MFRFITLAICALGLTACGMELDLEDMGGAPGAGEGEQAAQEAEPPNGRDPMAPTCHQPLPCGVGQPGGDDPRERFCPDPTGRGDIGGRIYGPFQPHPILWYRIYEGGAEYMRCDGRTGDAYLYTDEPDAGGHCVWYCSMNICPDLPDC